jgi:hypothetical protein
MYRGRLIYPFLIELAQLDIAGTAADPDGAGPKTSGYDPDFREPVVLPSSDKLGTSARAEKTMIQVPGQFGSTDSFADLQEAATGNLSPTEFVVLFHFRDLEAAGLVETTTGNAKIKIGDRMNAVYDYKAGTLIQTIRNPPGAFVFKAKPIFGLHNRRNLLEVHFRSRDPGSS